MADKELQEKAPPMGVFKKLKIALNKSTKDLPGGPVTKAATLAGIDGAAIGAGYAAWGLPGAVISGGYGLYRGYKALKGEYDKLGEDVTLEDIITAVDNVYILRERYEEIKENLTDEDFAVFLEEGFTAEEIIDLFSLEETAFESLAEEIELCEADLNDRSRKIYMNPKMANVPLEGKFNDGSKGGGKKTVKESEQIDELKKSTLANYIKGTQYKSKYDASDRNYKMNSLEKQIDGLHQAGANLSGDRYTRVSSTRHELEDERNALKKKHERIDRNKFTGTIRAVDRLTGKFVAGKEVTPNELHPKTGKVVKYGSTKSIYKDYKAEEVENNGEETLEEKSILKKIQRAIDVHKDYSAANMIANAKKNRAKLGETDPKRIKDLTFSDRKFLATNRNDHLRVGIAKSGDLLYKNRQGQVYPGKDTEQQDDRGYRYRRYAEALEIELNDEDIEILSDIENDFITKNYEGAELSEEQLDEISKKVLGSYIKKASQDTSTRWGNYRANQVDYEHKWGTINRQDHNEPYTVKKALSAAKDAMTKSHNQRQDEISKKLFNRYNHVKKAVDRLTKEEVEQKLMENRDELEDIIRSSLNGDASNIKDKFEQILTNRISDLLDAKKEEVAQNLFNKTQEVEGKLMGYSESEEVEEQAAPDNWLVKIFKKKKNDRTPLPKNYKKLPKGEKDYSN